MESCMDQAYTRWRYLLKVSQFCIEWHINRHKGNGYQNYSILKDYLCTYVPNFLYIHMARYM